MAWCAKQCSTNVKSRFGEPYLFSRTLGPPRPRPWRSAAWQVASCSTKFFRDAQLLANALHMMQILLVWLHKFARIPLATCSSETLAGNGSRNKLHLLQAYLPGLETTRTLAPATISHRCQLGNCPGLRLPPTSLAPAVSGQPEARHDMSTCKHPCNSWLRTSDAP